MRTGLVRSGVVALALAFTAGAAIAQSAQPPLPRWVVASDQANNFWFHTLALLRVQGPGPLPYYDDAYVTAIAQEKQRRGVRPSLLDSESRRLHNAFMADSAFEVLHFLPLYLERTRPESLPDFLRRIASGAPPGGEHELEATLGTHFGTAARRALLISLANAMEHEWRTFYAEFAATRRTAAALRRRELQARWDEGFAPQIAELVRTLSIPRGVLLIVPALGAEGRTVNFGPAGIVIAVSEWSGTSVRDAPLLAAVRELCFPWLTQLSEDRPNAALAGTADASSRAAVRCGALVMDAFLPATAEDYRLLFLNRRAGETAVQHRRRFDEHFHVDAATLDIVSQEIGRLVARATRALP